jgi:hypothetical protein
MTCLDGQDGASGSQKHGVCKKCCSTEICRYTHGLDYTCSCGHGGNVHQSRVEVKFTARNRTLASGFQGGLGENVSWKGVGRSKETYLECLGMSSLISLDDLKLFNGELTREKSSRGEIRIFEL